MVALSRGDIFWVNLDPTVGSEIKKTRPALIISNNLQNKYSNLIIIAPITSKIKKMYLHDVAIEIAGKKGKIVVDQLRAIDKKRLGKQLAMSEISIMKQVDEALKSLLNLSR